MRILVSAGEASGDRHAANLVRAMRRLVPGAEFAALGGPELEAAGARLLHDMTRELAVMGFLDGLRAVPAVMRVRNDALEFVDTWKPDAAVLVDYPGFNVHIARHLKIRGVKVFYYICPQVWAWAPWRVKKIGRRIDEALVVFEFERDFYARRGMPAKYVGHPLGDLFAARPLDEEFVARGPLSDASFVVALVPGSRRREIEKGFAVKLEAAEIIRRERPETTFAVPVVSREHEVLVRRIAEARGFACEVFVGRTFEVMKMAGFALATSGTATLELAHFATPMVVLYRTNPAGLVFKNLLLTTPHIALVNIIAGKRIVPELVYWRNRAETIAAAALEIICDENRYRSVTEEIEKVGRTISAPGASDNAAREILRALGTA